MLNVSPIAPLSPESASAPAPAADSLEDAFARIAAHCEDYAGGIAWRSVAQLILNIALYGGLIVASYAALAAGWWWASALMAPFAAFMLVRIFIIQHDCGHGSFFKSARANHIIGWALSLLTVTPYGFWRDSHNRHHAGSGNLERRGIGGIDTLTVAEFSKLSKSNQRLYKLYRNPLTMFFIGPPVYFLFLQRFPIGGSLPFSQGYFGMKAAQIWRSVMTLNIGMLVLYGLLSWAFGLAATAAVFIPIISISAIIGAWLFYVQHQFEDAYWRPQKEWNYRRAALLGSSHYDLPTPLRWATGNIGLHHIHHLCARIPNYRLQECFKASADLQRLPKLTIRESLKSASLHLWDERAERLVGFSAV